MNLNLLKNEWIDKIKQRIKSLKNKIHYKKTIKETQDKFNRKNQKLSQIKNHIDSLTTLLSKKDFYLIQAQKYFKNFDAHQLEEFSSYVIKKYPFAKKYDYITLSRIFLLFELINDRFNPLFKNAGRWQIHKRIYLLYKKNQIQRICLNYHIKGKKVNEKIF